MAEKTANATASAAAATKKVNRRGLSGARGVERLKFSHELAQNNGLFIGHLDSAEVRKILIGEDTTGMPQFNGMEIPQLVLTFASNEAEPSKRHYVTLRFSAVQSDAETIPGGKGEWKVNTVFDWTKHILDTFVFKGREMTDDEAVALSLPFEDFDEQGEYVPVEPETVVAGWTSFYENVANLLNTANDGKPAYKDKNGKNITIWIKLLRYQKVTKNKSSHWQPIANGELAFPTFVGEGCIEIYKQNTPASIRVNQIKEAIIPMKIDNAKKPNMPTPGVAGGMMGAPAVGGVPVGDNMMGNSMMGAAAGIAAEAAEDMPF